MLFPLLWFVLFFSSAHAIPQYTLGDMDNTKIVFNNQAVFQTDIFHRQAISDWTAGDMLEIHHEFPSFFFPMAIQFRDGVPIVAQTVWIKNITRNSKIPTHLLPMPVMGALKISSIDLPNHSVVLSDATDWTIAPDDQGRLNLWEVNDDILMGYNMGLQSSIFEFILLNVTQQSLVRAEQQ